MTKAAFWRLCRLGQVPIIFAVIALLFGLIIVKEVPPFWEPDEPAHFGRAYQISEGQFLSQRMPNGNYGGMVPTSVAQLDSAVYQNLLRIMPGPLFARHDFIQSSLQTTAAGEPLDQAHKAILYFPGAAVYSPLAYVAPAAGIAICRLADCSLGHAVLVARTFSLLSYVCVVAFALWILKAKRIKWLVFVVGLLPMTIFQAASVSADGPILSLGLLLFAIVVKALADRKLSPFLIGLLAVITVCLPLIKPSYGFLDLSLLLITSIVFKDKKKALLYTMAFIGVIAILSLGWIYLVRGPGKMISSLQAANSAHTVVSAKQQVHFVLHRPDKFAEVVGRTVVYSGDSWTISTVGQFALNWVGMPLISVVYAYLMLACAAGYVGTELIRYRKAAVVLGLLAIFTALSIIGTLYLSFTPVGNSTVDGVQGRYFIPLLPFFAAAAAALLPIKVSMSPKTATLLFSISSCALLLTGVIYYGLATY